MKIKKLIVLMMLLTSIISSFAISASAKNNKDVEFSYSLPNEGYYKVYGEGHRKEDASGSYVFSNYTNPSGGTYYSIHGGYTESIEGGYRNCTKMIRPLSMQVRKDV